MSRNLASYITLIFFWLGTVYVFWPKEVKNAYGFIENSISFKKIMSWKPSRLFTEKKHKKNRVQQRKNQNGFNLKFLTEMFQPSKQTTKRAGVKRKVKKKLSLSMLQKKMKNLQYQRYKKLNTRVKNIYASTQMNPYRMMKNFCKTISLCD